MEAEYTWDGGVAQAHSVILDWKETHCKRYSFNHSQREFSAITTTKYFRVPTIPKDSLRFVYLLCSCEMEIKGFITLRSEVLRIFVNREFD